MAQVLRDDIDFASYLLQTEPKQKVRPAGEWMPDLIGGLTPQKGVRSIVLPWQKTHELIAFRSGEVSLWAGINGHGKSLMTGQVMLSLMAQGERVCIASFEMKPVKTLERMARQFSGQAPKGEWMRDPQVVASFKDIYEQFGCFFEGHLWLYDQQGTVRAEVLKGVIRYCAHELRIGHIVIDNLAKCVKGSDDYSAQKDFVDELCAYARDYNVHIHLVHHIRKQGAETEVPNKMDVKGAGEITDQVDNVLIVWRNKKKERDAQAGKTVAPEECDAFLICDKQRNGEWEGRIALYWEPASQQFVGNPGAPALDFAAFPHRG
jgi:twinkle protein